MRVHQISVNGDFRYVLIDNNGFPVIPVVKYLKYLDNCGKSRNTLKSYCYHLKFYFEFLSQIGKGYQDVNLHLLARFTGWLRNPYGSVAIIPMLEHSEKKVVRSGTTINSIIGCVVGFYDYLFRTDEFTDKDINKNTQQLISSRYRSFKPFLHHVSKGKGIRKNILMQRVVKNPIKTLTHEQVKAIHLACNNIRDRLLIRVLYETGMRIGETLALWIEDFEISTNSITVRDSKTVSGIGRKVYVSSETMNLFQDYLFDYHAFEVDCNFVFVTLRGKNKGECLTENAVASMVRRIKNKTGIIFSPHLFRHTFATKQHENGMDAAILQKMLGHKNVQTTINIYCHPSEQTIRDEYNKAMQRSKGEKP